MSLALDHLVVAARTLEEGAAWLEARMGVPTVPGGRHALMGTHNRLLGLGAGAYLEIIAIDPQAPAPPRPRWFALDSPAMHRRLASGPALVGEVLALSRGDYRWRIGVPPDGSLPGGGAFPTLIQWEGDRHPATALPDEGCALERLTVRAPGGEGLLATLRRLGLADSAPVDVVESDAVGASAILRSPRGMVILPEAAGAE